MSNTTLTDEQREWLSNSQFSSETEYSAMIADILNKTLAMDAEIERLRGVLRWILSGRRWKL